MSITPANPGTITFDPSTPVTTTGGYGTLPYGQSPYGQGFELPTVLTAVESVTFNAIIPD